jgi:hypothetical protein
MPSAVPNSNPAKVYSVWATLAWVPIKLVGDGAVNVGLFVKSILEQPQKTLPGKFVLAATDDMTAGELAAAWAHLQGKKSVYLEVEKETYYNMWPIWGEEMDISHMYWELMKDQSFSGESCLTKDDLGLTGLVDTKAAFAKLQRIQQAPEETPVRGLSVLYHSIISQYRNYIIINWSDIYYQALVSFVGWERRQVMKLSTT